MALTAKQARFVEEYLIDLNATQAAIRAGYSAKTARQIGEQNLSKVDIAAAVEEAQKALSERTQITQDMVLRELARIGFVDIRKAVNWRSNVTEIGEDPDTGAPQLRAFNEVALTNSTDLDLETAAAIAEVSQTKDGALKVKFHDKQAALVSIGRHLGMFKDKLDVGGTVKVVISEDDAKL